MKDNSKAVYVSLESVRTCIDNFRCHVPKTTGHGHEKGGIFTGFSSSWQLSTQSKVEQLNYLSTVCGSSSYMEANIGRFEVTDNDAQAVYVIHGLGNLRCIIGDLQ